MTPDYKPSYEPTLQDVARAAQWLTGRFGEGRFHAADVESLSWLIAESRRKGQPEAAAGKWSLADVGITPKGPTVDVDK